MKFPRHEEICHGGCVAPFVGAWIEIVYGGIVTDDEEVAPFVGAWIEIVKIKMTARRIRGRSVRRSVD